MRAGVSGARKAAAWLGLPETAAWQLLACTPGRVGVGAASRAFSARLAAFAQLTADSAYASTPAGTFAAAAAPLRQTPDDQVRLRIVIALANDARFLHHLRDFAVYLAEPDRCGHAGCDALLAGLAVLLCPPGRRRS